MKHNGHTFASKEFHAPHKLITTCISEVQWNANN